MKYTFIVILFATGLTATNKKDPIQVAALKGGWGISLNGMTSLFLKRKAQLL